MYRQRSEPDRGTLAGRGLWRPQPEGEDVGFAPAEGDWYGVVDDVEGDRVVLVFDAWPNVGGAGNLVFAGDAVTRDFPIADFQRLLDRQRMLAQQPAADRALRVGDVFWIRTDTEQHLRDAALWRILDVTGPARRAARAAQLVAANPALRAPALEARVHPADPSPATPPQRPASGSASPAV